MNNNLSRESNRKTSQQVLLPFTTTTAMSRFKSWETMLVTALAVTIWLLQSREDSFSRLLLPQTEESVHGTLINLLHALEIFCTNYLSPSRLSFQWCYHEGEERLVLCDYIRRHNRRQARFRKDRNLGRRWLRCNLSQFLWIWNTRNL